MRETWHVCSYGKIGTRIRIGYGYSFRRSCGYGYGYGYLVTDTDRIRIPKSDIRAPLVIEAFSTDAVQLRVVVVRVIRIRQVGHCKTTRVAVDMKYHIHIHIHISTDAYPVYTCMHKIRHYSVTYDVKCKP